MKTAKYFAMLVSVLYIISLSTPAVAVEKTSDDYEHIRSEIDEHYDRYTIDFTDSISPSSDLVNSANTTTSVERISQAKNYVLSLDLEEMGLEHIQTSCLIQLEHMLENDFVLESYTVLVPKATRAPLNYYGTLNGRDYYQQYYSSYNGEARQVKTDTKEEDAAFWSAWFDYAADLLISAAFSAADAVFLPVAFDVFSTAFGIESPFEINDEAYMVASANYEISCRGIYTYDVDHHYGVDDDKLVLLLSDETGVARTYMTFYPVDPGAIDASEQFYYSPQIMIDSYQFGNREENMLCCQIQYNKRSGPVVYSLLPVVLDIIWEMQAPDD